MIRSTSAKLMSSTRPTSLIAAFARQRAERDDLRYLLAAVFLGDVLNHLAAPVRAEVDVDIRHADALRIQKALKQQAVLSGSISVISIA